MGRENDLPFKTRELTGFRLTQNTAVDQLEEHLGIRFPIRPCAVTMDWRNKLVMMGQQGVTPFLGAVMRDIISGGTEGYYDSRYHACFLSKEGGIFTSLHENMHAYNASMNFNFRLASSRLAEKVQTQITGLVSKPINVEEIMVLRCVDEGIAQWAAIETASQLTNDFDKEDLDRARNQMLNGSEDVTNDVNVDAEFMENEYKKVQTTIDLYNQAFGLRGPKVMQLGFKAEAVSQDAQYSTGYYFIERAMRTLTELGLSTNEALITLVKNPPTTINELRDPSLYVAHTIKPGSMTSN